jgi:hypothetical protein
MKLQKALAVIGVGAILFAATDAVTYATTGSSLVLGKINAANATTTIQNTGTNPALKLLTKSTATAPLVVNGKGKVTNLYADRAATADNASKLGGQTITQVRSGINASTVGGKTAAEIASSATPRLDGVIWVAKSGGQFTSVRAAMNSITGNGPHVINVAPGTYVETAPIVMKDNVDLAGSGQDRTTITCACAIALASGARSTVYVNGDVRAEIRNITLTNSGGAANVAAALELNQVTAHFSVVDTTLTATNANQPAFSAMAMWVGGGSNQPHIDGINTYTVGAETNYGVYYPDGWALTIRNSWIYVAGLGYSVDTAPGGSGLRIIDSMLHGPTHQAIGRCADLFDVNNDYFTCT